MWIIGRLFVLGIPYSNTLDFARSHISFLPVQMSEFEPARAVLLVNCTTLHYVLLDNSTGNSILTIEQE